MPALILILVAAAVFGGIVGWFSRGRIALTILVCVITPIVLLVGMQLSSIDDGSPADVWVDAFFYAIVPFCFLTVPCLVGGVLMSLVARRVRHGKLDKV